MTTVYVVRTTATGVAHYLRGTVFTSEVERATRYPTEADAKAAISKAAKFYPGSAARVIRNARIISWSWE